MQSLNLGKKIQDVRMKQDLSIRKLASLAGITPSMLSQIENEQVNPSINTLRSIAQALNFPLYTFFQEQPTEAKLIVHPGNRLFIGSKDKPDVLYELLTPDTKGQIEFCLMIIPPNLRSFRDSLSHKGEEVAYMLSGELVELELDGHLFSLTPGDSVRIASNVCHTWHNPTDTTVQIIFAVTPPTF